MLWSTRYYSTNPCHVIYSNAFFFNGPDDALVDQDHHAETGVVADSSLMPNLMVDSDDPPELIDTCMPDLMGSESCDSYDDL